MVADKGKKQKIHEKAEIEINNEEPIDGELVISIEKLQEIQDELEKINEEASEKVLEVEQKYNEVRKPIYDKRNGIINSIPDFWLTAFTSHPALGELLTDEDHQIFKYLKSIEVEDSQDVKSGYSIAFNFKPNLYFEDTKLTKTFSFLEEGTTKITGTAIRWKEGKGIPNGVVNAKNGNKRAHPEESFFTWFGDEGDMEELHEEVADIIKDDLWPNPLTYFNSEADEEEFEEEGNDEELDDDDKDKDKDEDDDDDDEDED